MPTNFPGSLDTFTTKVPHVSANAAADVNNLQDAVAAIEATLKTTPNPNPLDFVSKTQPDTITGVKLFLLGPGFGAAPPAALAAIAGLMGNVVILPPPRGGGLDDSANLQAIIDALSAAGGGEAWGWGQYTANIVLKAGVVLRGPDIIAYPYGTPHPFAITAFATGYAIDTPAGATYGCGVKGVAAYGLGSGTPGGGIRFQNVSRGVVDGFGGGNFADEALLVGASSIACRFDNIFAAGVANRTRSGIIGTVDIAGNDHWIGRVEATQQAASAVSSASLYCCSIVIRASGCWVGEILGEFADQGVYVSGNSNRFAKSRADSNYGHGWNVLGANNTFAACLGAKNSQDTTNTYDNFRADSASIRNQFTGCTATNVGGKVTKYGFEDLVASGSGNSYDNCISTGAATQQYLAQSSGGSSFSWPATASPTFTTATPDATGVLRAATGNSSPTTITDFTGGIPGQRLTLVCNDDNTTIQSNGSTISLIGGWDKKLISGRIYEFFRNGGTWNEISSAYFDTVSADNGDAAKTLNAQTSEIIQIWATALTANRAVTLATTHWFTHGGSRFRIVRKASATGASTLDVGSGPLKSLAAGQWCDVAQDGSGVWFLAAFGSL